LAVGSLLSLYSSVGFVLRLWSFLKVLGLPKSCSDFGLKVMTLGEATTFASFIDFFAYVFGMNLARFSRTAIITVIFSIFAKELRRALLVSSILFFQLFSLSFPSYGLKPKIYSKRTSYYQAMYIM
jgi:hypothetical protein